MHWGISIFGGTIVRRAVALLASVALLYFAAGGCHDMKKIDGREFVIFPSPLRVLQPHSSTVEKLTG